MFRANVSLHELSDLVVFRRQPDFFPGDTCVQSGVRALKTPVHTLVSNWAYLVMTSLAWSLKAWLARWPSMKGTAKEQATARVERHPVLRMEFKTFVNHFMRLPAIRNVSMTLRPLPVGISEC
ncbi:MAG: hypothetical protein RIS70_2656 [Planctomycetota bacterium]|jgi:hypothetical protein